MNEEQLNNRINELKEYKLDETGILNEINNDSSVPKKFLYKHIIKIIDRYMKPFILKINDLNKQSIELHEQIIQTLKLNELEISSLKQLIKEKDKEIAGLISRIEDDEKTIVVMSKSLQRVDGDEKTIILLSQKSDALEKSINDLNDKYLNMEEVFNGLKNLGIDINNFGKFNMLDKRTTSQAGEDSILAYIVAVLGIPFDKCNYIDLGANHPKEMNNTYFFYTHGARGILVEANPQLIPALRLYRNRDIILNNCVDAKSGDFVDFYILNVDGLSTSNVDSVNEVIELNSSVNVKEKVSIETISVNDIIERYLKDCPVILSVDIEGKDMEVLSSINFNKYRPLIIIVEMIEYSTQLMVGQKNENILNLMKDNDYVEFAFTGINSIFIDKRKVRKDGKISVR